MFKILGRITWQVLKIVAPFAARKFQHRLVGRHEEKPSRLSRVTKLRRR